MSAEDALRLGLANWLCRPEELADKTREVALELAQGPTVAYHSRKENLNRAIAGEVGPSISGKEKGRSLTAPPSR